MSIAWTFARAWDEFSGEARPIVTEALKREAPGRGNWTHTIAAAHESARILWVGSFKPWGFVVRGTRPHPILPVRAQMLRFEVNGRNGRVVFARRVAHPGTSPNRFQFRAWRAALPALKPLLKEAVRSGIEIRQPNPYRVTLT